VKRLFAFAMIALALLLKGGQNYNGIYLGEDVTGLEPAGIAVRIGEDGTVTAYRGAVVPGMHDRYGKQVRVTRVKLR
jgi:hypothetical protein